MESPILKMNSRILRPGEYKDIRRELKPHLQLIADGLLYTHTRIEEFWRLLDHPEWYKVDREVIDLPRGSILKEKARQKERTVLLSYAGVRVVEEITQRGDVAPMSRKVLGEDLKRAAVRAGIDPTGISPKMFRKTYVSWLMATMPEKSLFIATSAGHTPQVMIDHYLNLGLGKYKEDILPHVVGWGE